MCALRRAYGRCYYGFEANDVFDGPLHTIEQSLRAWGRPVKLFTSTAFNVRANE